MSPAYTNEPQHRHPWPGTRLPGAVRAAQRWAAGVRSVRAHNRRLPPDAPTLHFYPMRPDPLARMTSVAERLGLRIDTDLRAGQPTIAWDTGTWFSEAAHRRLPPDAINRNCTDISKSHVDRAWATVAGYSVAVDPLTFEGSLVAKSEFNGRHDGRILQGPLAKRRPGFVYQRFVDSVEGDQLVDLRTSIIGGDIPVLIRRHHPLARWFDWSTRSALADPAEEFSASERAQLLAFAALIGLECGELDVLRDRQSGLIYVLDANRTPNGPLPSEDSPLVERVATLVAEAFAGLMAERWP